MSEVFSVEGPHRQFLRIGDTLSIGERSYKVLDVVSTDNLGKRLGVRVKRSIPVYYLDGVSGQSRGAYDPGHEIVLAFANTDEETLRHELTHVVEYHQPKTPELLDLHERAKRRITERSFDGGFVSFNFMKDIHEFIADGRTKPALIAALRKEQLYDDFVRLTRYLFD